MITPEFGSRVKSARESRCLSQRDLAVLTEGVVSQSGLHRMEKGVKEPQFDEVLALAWALGISVEDLTEENPLSARVQYAARGDSADYEPAITALMPLLELRVALSKQGIGGSSDDH